MKWTEEEEELFYVLAAKDLSISGKDVCEIAEGDVGEGKFGKGWYTVKILAKGERVCVVSNNTILLECYQLCEKVIHICSCGVSEQPCRALENFL